MARKKKNKQKPTDLKNFYNLELRAMALVNQLGFDPVVMKPIPDDLDLMVYVHMDGDETNDDPKTHGWVLKETYEKYFKNRSSTTLNGQSIQSQADHIIQHFEKHVGEVENSIHTKTSDPVPLSIHIIPPTKNRNYGVMFTTGMSFLPMTPPPSLEKAKYAELFIKLPPDWPLPLGELKKDDYFWVIEELLNLPTYVHRNKQWFFHGHTIGNGHPPKFYANNTKLCGFLFSAPHISLSPEFAMLKISPSKIIFFLQLIPLYKEEIDFKNQHGYEKLMKKFSENILPNIVDLQRKNVCS